MPCSPPLALVQLSTVWVVVSISSPSPKPFYRRLPPLRRYLRAACPRSHLLACSRRRGYLRSCADSQLLHLPIWSPKQPNEVHASTVTPSGRAGHPSRQRGSHVLLRNPVRRLYFAAFRPPSSPEEDAIIPFDRSFDGTLEPALVGGKGFVTMKDAFALSRVHPGFGSTALYMKIFLASMAVYAVFGVILFLEFLALGAFKSENRVNWTLPMSSR